MKVRGVKVRGLAMYVEWPLQTSSTPILGIMGAKQVIKGFLL